MPPKPKFTKEEIVAAALDLVSERGMDTLTSRDLGAKLGSSARPIFTVFKNMEEVQQEVRRAARDRFVSYAQKAVRYTPPFKQLGMQMLLFAKEEPKLYELLFMKNDGMPHSLDEGYLCRDRTAMLAMDMIQKEYGLRYEEARKLFHYVWIFTFGIGALCATGMCHFTDEELNELLGQDFMAMIVQIKSGAIHQPTVHPILKE